MLYLYWCNVFIDVNWPERYVFRARVIYKSKIISQNEQLVESHRMWATSELSLSLPFNSPQHSWPRFTDLESAGSCPVQFYCYGQWTPQLIQLKVVKPSTGFYLVLTTNAFVSVAVLRVCFPYIQSFCFLMFLFFSISLCQPSSFEWNLTLGYNLATR